MRPLSRRSFISAALSAAIILGGILAAAPVQARRAAPMPELTGEYQGTYSATSPQGPQAGSLRLIITRQDDRTRKFEGTLQPDWDAAQPGPLLVIVGKVDKRSRVSFIGRGAGFPKLKAKRAQLSEDGSTLSGSWKASIVRGELTVSRVVAP